MGEVKGFLKFKRKSHPYRPVCERVKDYAQVSSAPAPQHSKEQASRCMDCGTPFCHGGCPIGNYIPEWNDAVFTGRWQKALLMLDATNNLPEVTGRICPAPCEYACVLGINDDPVTIRENEFSIIEYAFKHNLIKTSPPKIRTGKTVAVIGSGPAGLSCAHQLNKAGHRVTVFERDDKIGGILRYGIPDFKLEKGLLDRRIQLFKKEGILFKTGICVGTEYPAKKLRKEFDALCLACGSRQPRDLCIEGRELAGIHFAMDFLSQSNKRVAGERFSKDALIEAKDKRVVVIGGGDTGADCVGTAHRQGASCVVQIEIMPKPSEQRPSSCPWPGYPMLLKTATSHEEGGSRDWSVLTKRFIGNGKNVRKLSCVKGEFSKDKSGCPTMKEIAGSEFEIEADLVILALGFLHPEKKGLIEELKLELDPRGNVSTGLDFLTSQKGIFSCGDMHRGQSLVVWAISEGRRSAHSIDKYLMGETNLSAL